MKIFAILYISALILVLLIPSTPSCSNSSLKSSPTSLMQEYLLNNYNQSINLVSESPNANPEVYWLYSDNFLASVALEDSYPDISTTIKKGINTYQISTQDKYQVIEGTVMDNNIFMQDAARFDIQANETNIIKIEKANPNVIMNDWQEYADRLLLAAINYANNNEHEQALQLFNKANDMYDGTGFADICFSVDGYYSTYKLALYLIAANRLEATLPERNTIISTFLELQDTNVASNRYGGIYTDYTADKNPLPDCDTNTETTSLCLIALNSE